MKASNPKQVVVLSVVAIGAIGYLGHSLFGLGNAVVARIVGQTEPETKAESAEPPAIELLGDPFAHPKLASNGLSPASTPPPTSVTSPQATDPSIPEPSLPPPTIGGSLPLKPQFGIVPEASPKPAETTGNDREKNENQGPRVALTAIVKVDKPVAFLSLNGKESRAYRPGDLLAPGIRLTHVGSSSIRFQSPTASYHLSVGQEIEP